jgi:hypothetical protein
MFAADLMLLEQSDGTGTDRKAGEGGDSGLEISARYLLLSQTASTYARTRSRYFGRPLT